jgi:tRNA-2-methylthio-N6-dimethylallyladenosine synthase
MNFSDSEIVASILNEQGYNTTMNQEEADLILLNTCSIREKAEQTVRMRLSQFKNLKKKNQIIRLVFLAVWLKVLKPNSWKKNNWLILLLVQMLTEIFQIY